MFEELPVPVAREETLPEEAWEAGYQPPPMDLSPLSRAECWRKLRDGELAADHVEEAFVACARGRSAIELGLGEGLAELQKGDRLARLNHHLGDYARERLGLSPKLASGLALLAKELRSRPILRRAVLVGEVKRSAAEKVLPVAVGPAEGYWVCRARSLTVRKLKAEIAKARANPAEAEEELLRFRVRCTPEERVLIDEALELAGQVLPGSTRGQRLEAMAQEFLSGAAAFVAEEMRGRSPFRPGRDDFRPLGGSAARRDERCAQLEAETDRWAVLAHVADWEMPDVRFEQMRSVEKIDRNLRKLAALWRGWGDRVGYLALLVKKSRIHVNSGFADFRQYCTERAKVSPRAIEQRAALEERLWAVPALRAARDEGMNYEKLRTLARLPDADIPAWIPRARGLTVIALRREVEGETERQMSAAGRLGAVMEEPAGEVLATALETARNLAGCRLPAGKCLAFIAQHFLEVWGPQVKGPKTLAQKARKRDGGRCQVPGCSHAAMHAHHGQPRGQGGPDELWNLVSLCVFHHLRCIHEGWLRVYGRAPDALRWELAGRTWTGGTVG